ncbi:MAG: SOS response-associated peptidase [Alphaproteobacteria bacterium]|nr:SOS response-associated peptidase [Alphaproteobacteria bacterium]
MCSRYSLTSPHEAVRSYFGYGNEHAFPPRYNIAPTDPAAIVRPGGRHARELVLVRWGLIPGWVKDPGQFSTLINARSETLRQKPSFRGAIRHKRCLVPANGFYEWTGARGSKKPHYIHRAGGGARDLADLPPLAFAGLYEDWLGPDGSEIDTMAIITVPANGVVGRLHDRMPAILEPHEFEAWLDVKNVRDDEAVSLLQPAAEDLLEVTEVSPEVNNPRAEGPRLIEPMMPRLL